MLVHWIWLAHRSGVSDYVKAELLRHFSDPEDIYFARTEDFSHLESLTKEAVQGLMDKDLTESEKILADVMKYKLHVLTYRDAAYPQRLKAIPDPPLVLYYKGNIPDFDNIPVIGVVGTRKASGYGLNAAKKFGDEIARCGGMIVSGMAFGIDGMAMRSALSAGGSVVGILGCGAEQVYPPSNAALFADMERYGCILSEFPPETPPYRWNFPKRNRIISGLSCGVLVVEAPEKSGALITARQALEQGRDVFVVPGNLDQPTFVGSNRLLKEGGILAESGWEILREYEAMYPGKIQQATGASRQRAYPDEVRRVASQRDESYGKVAQNKSVPRNKPPKKEKSYKKDVDKSEQGNYSDVNNDLSALPEDHRAILDCLAGGERLVDEIIAQLGLPAGKISSALTLLTIKGLVKRLPGNRVCRK